MARFTMLVPPSRRGMSSGSIHQAKLPDMTINSWDRENGDVLSRAWRVARAHRKTNEMKVGIKK